MLPTSLRTCSPPYSDIGSMPCICSDRDCCCAGAAAASPPPPAVPPPDTDGDPAPPPFWLVFLIAATCAAPDAAIKPACTQLRGHGTSRNAFVMPTAVLMPADAMAAALFSLNTDVSVDAAI